MTYWSTPVPQGAEPVRVTTVEFTAPGALSTSYVRSVTWPPQATVADGPFVCAETTEEPPGAGTRLQTIDGREFCVTETNEGAAGSIYTDYVYATELEGKVITFTFSLRRVQCANYEELESAVCQDEQEQFDLDAIVSEMARSARLVESYL